MDEGLALLYWQKRIYYFCSTYFEPGPENCVWSVYRTCQCLHYTRNIFLFELFACYAGISISRYLENKYDYQSFTTLSY